MFLSSHVGGKAEEDDNHITSLGYKQDLFRGINGLMSFCFGFVEVGVLVSLTSMFGFGLASGGPVTMVASWIVTSVLTICACASMAEICCAYPTAGSVYTWAGNLSPKQSAIFWAYWTGAFNWLGNASGDASFAWVFSTFLSSALSSSGFGALSNDMMVTVAIIMLFMWSLINSIRVDQMGWLMNFAAFLQLGATLSLILVVLLMCPSLNSTQYVFTTHENETGFESKSYVFCISLLFSMFSFSGYEASAHLAEETTSATTAAPWGILSTGIATGICGLALILPLLYSMKDVQSAIDADFKGSNAVVEIIYQATSSKAVSSGFAWMLVIIIFFGGLSAVAVTARITFALCRDNAFPFSETLAVVYEPTKSPLNVLIFIFFFDSCLILFALGSTTAFYNIVGMSNFGFQLSYAIPIVLQIFASPDSHSSRAIRSCEMYFGDTMSPLMRVISAIWLLSTCVILLFPTQYPVTVANMNYTCVVVLSICVVGHVNWILNAKFKFRGPKRIDDYTRTDTDDNNIDNKYEYSNAKDENKKSVSPHDHRNHKIPLPVYSDNESQRNGSNGKAFTAGYGYGYGSTHSSTDALLDNHHESIP